MALNNAINNKGSIGGIINGIKKFLDSNIERFMYDLLITKPQIPKFIQNVTYFNINSPNTNHIRLEI